ncbi:Ribosomal RNA small subunit methyltransferase B [Methylophilaceae bacterium]|nr:Ribosomal RNA small subunit methyltransferase B [Methylophilaceae bacterium]
MNRIDPNLLRLAGMALADVLNNPGPADAKLGAFFRQNRELGTRERAFVAESVYGVLRRKGLLAHLTGGEDPRKLLLALLLRVQGMSLRDLDASLSKRQKEWAQEIKARSTDGLSLAQQADLPDWLWQKLSAQYGEAEALTIARSMHQPASLDLRVNTIKATREEVAQRFASESTAVTPTPYSPIGLRMPQKMTISRHPFFTDGKIEVQDEGSQLLAHLVAPRRGEMVADFCAGAGGKTLALGALMRNSGRLYAFDVSEKRLSNLGQRLKRSGLSNLHSQLIQGEQDPKLKRLQAKFDRVLVDAPCSGLGTLRRNPDLKWRQTEQDITELTAKQASILARAARLVKGGGRLIYATCSLLADENEKIAEAFLATHPEFTLVPANQILAQQHIGLDTGNYLKLFPHVHQTDGFFAAVFTKTAGEKTEEAA